MDFKDFKEFFDEYVKGYKPYKDSVMFNVFTNFLSDRYFSDSYVDIPSDFKTAFEQQILPSAFIVPFLESIGITSTIISSLSITDRFKVATLMSDFHRYKGTVTLIDKLLTNFSENQSIAIYELYLDKNVTDEWVVLPSLLNKSALVSNSLTDELPFSTLDAAQHWYIDTDTLNSLNDDGEIELPYKTNVLLIDGSIQEEISLIVYLVSALVQESFNADQIQLFFKDSVSFATTFRNFDILWHYILRYVANKGTIASPFPIHTDFNPALVFNQYEIPTKTNTLPRGKINIQSILDEHSQYIHNTSSLTISTDIWVFFTTKVNIFSGPLSAPVSDFLQYRVVALTALGESLIGYIDNRLSNATVLADEVHLLLGELYSSMLTFKIITTSTLNTDYIDYYLLTLTGFTNDLSNSSFFTLLDFLKPMHCDLISDFSGNIFSKSIFDSGLASYITAFAYIMEQVTHHAISDNSNTLSVTPNIYDNQLAISAPAAQTIKNTASDGSVVIDSSGPYTYDNPVTLVHTVFLT